MKALVFEEKLSLQDVPVPNPLPDEALVKVRMAGICKTDVEIVKGLHELSRGAQDTSSSEQ